MLDRYTVDDQVRLVEIHGDNQEHILFEGVLLRESLTVQADEQRDGEGAGITAFDFSHLDRVHPKHQILGRDFSSSLTWDFGIVEDITMPAAFNYQGLPNRNPAGDTNLLILHHGPDFDAISWTFDGDANAEYWTAGDALRTLLGRWLYGEQGLTPLPRWLTLDPDFATALANETTTGKYEGLGVQLPELDVTGLDVVAACRAVADAVGMRVYRDIVSDPDGLSGDLDRRYTLRIERRGAGTQTQLNLAERGTAYDIGDTDSAEDFHAANDFHRARLLKDAAPVHNIVHLVGRTYIEARLPLFPLWKQADVDGSTIDAELQREKVAATPTDWTAYQQAHVMPGASNPEVGRLWGINHDGSFATGYPSGSRYYSDGGFDFVGEFDMNGSNPMKQRRTDANLDDDIVWTSRARPFLPLTGKAFARAGIEYQLEVSEDGGTNSEIVSREVVDFNVLNQFGGLFLTGQRFRNLANVSLAALKEEVDHPAIEDSWWALMFDQAEGSESLLMWLHCRVVADHAYRAIATKQATSASIYQRQLLRWNERVAEVWRHPDLDGNDSGDWQRTALSEDGAATQSLEDTAARLRQDMEGVGLSGLISVNYLQRDRFRLGNTITAINGRGISLARQAGTAEIFPSIITIEMTFADNDQSVQVQLEDERLTRGGRRS